MPGRRKRSSRLRRWSLRFAIGVTALFLLSVALTLPLRWLDPATTAFMLRDDSGREPLLHEWVEWSRISDAAPLAVVAAEDQRFSDHAGLDFASIQSSIETAERGGRLRGASTISQQLAKNLYLWPGRSIVRKGLEAYLTLLLEIFLPKKRILELYLNVAEFGPGIYGVGAAADYYFDRPASRLHDVEAALLAAVLPSPRRLHVERPSPYVRERQFWILGQMGRLRREGWLTTLDRG